MLGKRVTILVISLAAMAAVPAASAASAQGTRADNTAKAPTTIYLDPATGKVIDPPGQPSAAGAPGQAASKPSQPRIVHCPDGSLRMGAVAGRAAGKPLDPAALCHKKLAR